MPYHKVPRATLHEDIRAIERDHEVIVSVVANHEDCRFLDVFTRYCGQEPTHTRGGVA